MNRVYSQIVALNTQNHSLTEFGVGCGDKKNEKISQATAANALDNPPIEPGPGHGEDEEGGGS